jgi:hypothetical protein
VDYTLARSALAVPSRGCAVVRIGGELPSAYSEQVVRRSARLWRQGYAPPMPSSSGAGRSFWPALAENVPLG